MHDLATINRLNAERFEAAISLYQNQGRAVLAHYDGLTLVSLETFSDADEALRAHQAATARIANAGKGSDRVRLHLPRLPGSPEAALARGRDQSEDRPAAVPTSADLTVGDYAARLDAHISTVDNSRHGY